MTTRSKVELFEQIRKTREHEGLSVRGLARRFKTRRRTVREALASPVPAPRKPAPERVSPVLDPWKATIDGWLEADRDAPKKQRHTARRVWQRLVEEHGADVGESTVRRYVGEARRRQPIRLRDGVRLRSLKKEHPSARAGPMSPLARLATTPPRVATASCRPAREAASHLFRRRWGIPTFLSQAVATRSSVGDQAQVATADPNEIVASSAQEATSAGPDLARADLSGEAIRLARGVHGALPEEPEVAGLLALMLLNDARRPARTRADGELVPLAEQDRTLWDRDLIAEGVALVTDAFQRGRVGEYQLQAAIAAVHDQAGGHGDTDWVEIVSLYCRLERMTGNPMVRLNRAVAVAMAEGPSAGLALLAGLGDTLGDHHRLHSVRAHLLELAGDTGTAVVEFRAAAARATNLREQQYLTTKAAGLATERAGRVS